MPFAGSWRLEASTSRRRKTTLVAEGTGEPVRMDQRLALRLPEIARALPATLATFHSPMVIQ